MNRNDWRMIPGFSRYRVNSFGDVWNVVFDRPMRVSVATPQGNKKVSLIDDDGVRRSCSLAILVALAFVQQPNPRCDHVIVLDGDYENLVAHNLAWRTRRQAYLYARQLRTPPSPNWLSIPIIDLDTGVQYDNVYHCGISQGLLFADIMQSCIDTMANPNERTEVYPHGHTYQFVYRV